MTEEYLYVLFKYLEGKRNSILDFDVTGRGKFRNIVHAVKLVALIIMIN